MSKHKPPKSESESESEILAEGKSSSPRKIIIAVFALPIIFIAISMAILNPQKPSAQAFNDSNSPSRGNPNAQIVIHEFSDYGCIHCKDAQLIVNHLVKQYGNVIKVVNKDFPLSTGTEAIAQRIRCAQKQGKFFEFADVVFEKQSEWGTAQNNEALLGFLNSYATALGIDNKGLDACMVSGDTKTWVKNDKEEGKNNKVSGTPTFFLNGVYVGSIAKLQEELTKLLGVTPVATKQSQPIKTP